jgi:uncharacterized protein
MLYSYYMPETSIRNAPELLIAPEIEQPEIRTVIAKVVGGCNLVCYPDENEDSTCYMYHKDTAYLQRPNLMTIDTVAKIGESLVKDVETRGHSPEEAEKLFLFHGGEPLLRTPQFFRDALAVLTDITADRVPRLRTALQTNGTRLDEEYLDVFHEFNTTVGISLDGDREANAGRVYKNGLESFDDVLRAIELINQPYYRHLFDGIIGVVNLDSDPDEVYDFYKGLLVPDEALRQRDARTGERRLPTLDLLTPLGDHSDPPYRDETQRMQRPFAQWMQRIDRRWIENDMNVFRLRSTQVLLNKMAGKASNLDSFGGNSREQVVVQTNGVYALTDTLLSAEGGITDLPASVYRQSLEQVSHLAARKLERLGALSISDICATQCPEHISSVCGGGTISARYDAASERPFDNPAVNCYDLAERITEVKGLAVAISLRKAHERAIGPLLPSISYNTDQS